MDEEIRKLEMRLLRPEVRSSPEELEALLADDFREFGVSGRTFDRKQIIEDLKQETRFEATVHDFHTRTLGPDTVLATYRAIAVPIHGEKRISLRSSIWVCRRGNWRLLFHQGTPMKQLQS